MRSSLDIDIISTEDLSECQYQAEVPCFYTCRKFFHADEKEQFKKILRFMHTCNSFLVLLKLLGHADVFEISRKLLFSN